MATSIYKVITILVLRLSFPLKQKGIFHKLDEIVNNANIGIKGFTT